MTSAAVHPRISVSVVSRWPVARTLDFLSGLGVGAISLTTARLGDPPDEVIDLVVDAHFAMFADR